MKNRVLITGGAGYIGSHVVNVLSHSHHITVLDNLSTGFRDAIGDEVTFIHGQVQDVALVENILRQEKIDTVIHLAASTVISQSIQQPIAYYQNNTVGTLHLLEACARTNVKYFIYSSTAAVYGNATCGQIGEQAPTLPQNPYGHSKLMSEQMLKDVAAQQGLQYVILRYFNVAGAAPEGHIGQRTRDATHLIKVAAQTACGLHPAMPIYGTHYPTPDGTCVRDFIHVSDIASAHAQALLYLKEGGPSVTLNCGYGRGFSVKEVVGAIEKIIEKPLPVVISDARDGDLATVIADTTCLKKTLNWQPQYDDLHYIVQTALNWEKRLLSA